LEPSKTREEIAAMLDFSVPPGFAVPLVPQPDNARFQQGVLQQHEIIPLLQKLG
jgi:hypothetical protein